MKSKIMLFLESAIALSIVLLLSGCFGDGGSSNAYDGTWTVVYVDSAFVAPAPAASGGTATCLLPTPLAKITLVNGIGSTIQYNPCYNTEVTPLNIVYPISVTITASTGAVSAIVDGAPLSGQCINTHGCAANTGTASLSLTR
jgi:hypothetical protein